MFEISKANSKTWSRMGARAFYGSALSAVASDDHNIIAISADLGRSSGLARFANEHPERFINTGIAEQNMVGTAAGLARMGFDVFASTFAPFASLRAGEIVRMNMGYMHEPVKLVALGSGLAMGFLGNSHYGLEDVGVMRTIPNLTIISPADCAEIWKTLQACVGFEHPVYIRLTGALNLPVVYEEDYDFAIGKGVWIRPVQPTTIISSGTTVGHALSVVKQLEEDGTKVGLLNMHTIKPLDAEAIARCAANCGQICVIEEHTSVGGLGSAVLQHINEHHPDYRGRVLLHSIADRYVETGNYAYLLEMNKLDAPGIRGFLKERAGVS
jgi:transketolase